LASTEIRMPSNRMARLARSASIRFSRPDSRRWIARWLVRRRPASSRSLQRSPGGRTGSWHRSARQGRSVRLGSPAFDTPAPLSADARWEFRGGPTRPPRHGGHDGAWPGALAFPAEHARVPDDAPAASGERASAPVGGGSRLSPTAHPFRRARRVRFAATERGVALGLRR
jgi:hypothetical protein